MASFPHEHLVHGELAVQVALDFVLHVRVDRHLQEAVIGAGVTLHHVVAAAEVLPRPRPQRRRYALPTPTAYLQAQTDTVS